MAGADVVAAPSVLAKEKDIPITTPVLLKPLTLDEKIELVATKYQVNAQLMRAVIKCESAFRPDAIGDGGTSFGLVQINLPSHPTITKEQAFDVDFSLDFFASNLAAGRGRMWTCWRMLQQ